jgi:hypothetical protein
MLSGEITRRAELAALAIALSTKSQPLHGRDALIGPSQITSI